MTTHDISRFLLQPKKHYVAALRQQGRAILDSDFNEGAHLSEEEQRLAFLHSIGPKGSADAGFSIRGPLSASEEALQVGDPLAYVGVELGGVATSLRPVALRAGSYYVGGLRFELEAPEDFQYQRDFLQMGPDDLPSVEADLSDFHYVYFLRGWEQPVTAVEDVEVSEVMLRGPQTSNRMRRMRRIEVIALASDPEDCDTAWSQALSSLEVDENSTFDVESSELRSNGRLQLEFTGGEAEDLCAPCDPHGKRYLGAENQSLLVKLTSDSSYVWSLDGGGPLFKIKVRDLAAGGDLTVEVLDPSGDERHIVFKDRVVEIVPFAALLDGSPAPDPNDGHYARVADQLGAFLRAADHFDPSTNTFTLADEDGRVARVQDLISQWDDDHPLADQLNHVSADGSTCFYMRLWNQAPTAEAIEIPTTSTTAMGTTGVRALFPAAGRAGDFWLAALRPNTPAQVVPFELLNEGGIAPHGPRTYLAPLGVLNGEAGVITSVGDCRPRIRSLNRRGCATCIVGDGIRSNGDYTSIQDAINALPSSGGRIEVRPGIYRERVEFFNRSNITLVGCGPETIIEPPADDLYGVRLTYATNISIRGFQIRARRGRAISTGRVNRLNLSELLVVSAIRTRIEPADLRALVNLQDANRVEMSDVTIHADLQTGLLFGYSTILSVERVEVHSGTRNSNVPLPPLVSVQSHGSIQMRECRFFARGQVGLSMVQVIRVKCHRMLVESDHQDVGYLPGQAAVDLDDADRVDFIDGRLRMKDGVGVSPEAALSIQGTNITVEGTAIIGDSDDAERPGASVWGGVHIRGGSENVKLLRNRIDGGFGHGVSLGGLTWTQTSNGTQRRYGPGQTQITTLSDGRLAALGLEYPYTSVQGQLYRGEPDDPLVNITVRDNRIENMGGNGISSLAVMGVGSAQALFQIERLRIERNVIMGNLRALSNPGSERDEIGFPASTSGRYLAVRRLAFGGVVLPMVTGALDIAENAIENNGSTNEQTQELPVNGIYVTAADAAQITDNRIANNGMRPTESSRLAIGVRAGIGIMLAGAPSDIVAERDLHVFVEGEPEEVSTDGFALRVINNTVRQPEGRALHAVAIGATTVQGNFLSSEGNHDSELAQDEFSIGDVVYVQNLGAPWERFEADVIRGDNNFPGYRRINDQIFKVLYDIGNSRSPYMHVGLGGQIMFANNQVVYDWQVVRAPEQSNAPLSYFPCAILTLDHASVTGNQFSLMLGTDEGAAPPNVYSMAPLLAGAFVYGASVNIELNRCSETVGSTFLSILAMGEVMNITAMNQTTHKVYSIIGQRSLASGHPPQPNYQTQTIFELPESVFHGGVENSLRLQILNFARLTFNPTLVTN